MICVYEEIQLVFTVKTKCFCWKNKLFLQGKQLVHSVETNSFLSNNQHFKEFGSAFINSNELMPCKKCQELSEFFEHIKSVGLV